MHFNGIAMIEHGGAQFRFNAAINLYMLQVYYNNQASAIALKGYWLISN